MVVVNKTDLHTWQYHHIVFALQFAYPVKTWYQGWCVYQQGCFY
nr:MAG TPA: Ras of Complex, Roc, domain of DAPkinase [Bacteriophage sp.]